MKVNQQAANDAEAKEWLMEYAVSKIMHRGKKGTGAEQVVRENGGYRLADGVTFDSLTYDGKLVGFPEPPDPHKVFHDPFNPLTGGPFSENIRAKGKDDLTELRESMREFGWIEELPAIEDERGVVIMGHRRLAMAKELGITSVAIPTSKSITALSVLMWSMWTGGHRAAKPAAGGCYSPDGAWQGDRNPDCQVPVQ